MSHSHSNHRTSSFKVFVFPRDFFRKKILSHSLYLFWAIFLVCSWSAPSSSCISSAAIWSLEVNGLVAKTF